MPAYRRTQALVAAALLTLAGSTGATLQVRHENGVMYVTGGVGQSEQREIRGLTDHYNLKLTLSLEEGEFLAGIAVRIEREDGATVLDTDGIGPYLLAQLQPGRYRVEVSYEGAMKAEMVHIRSADDRKALQFRW